MFYCEHKGPFQSCKALTYGRIHTISFYSFVLLRLSIYGAFAIDENNQNITHLPLLKKINTSLFLKLFNAKFHDSWFNTLFIIVIIKRLRKFRRANETSEVAAGSLKFHTYKYGTVPKFCSGYDNLFYCYISELCKIILVMQMSLCWIRMWSGKEEILLAW